MHDAHGLPARKCPACGYSDLKPSSKQLLIQPSARPGEREVVVVKQTWLCLRCSHDWTETSRLQ